jgi:hypothetical protein
MKPLYQLTTEYAFLLDSLYESAEDGDGEIATDQAALLESIAGDAETKIENCCKVLKDLQASRSALKEEADRLALRAKRLDSRSEWLKSYIKNAMEVAGWTKVSAGVFNVRIQNNPESVEILNLDLVPHEFDVPQDRVVSKTVIKNALKEGRDVPGVQLVRGTHLRIS